MSYMASHVTNLATKYEDPTPIRSSVTSYNVSRWLPLKVRTRPLFDVFCVKIGARVSAVAFLKNRPPPLKKVAESLCAEGREVTHAQNRNP